MSRDLYDFYRSLADEADARTLPVPETLRRAADRRARVRMTGTALAAAVLVAGVATGTRLALSAEPTPVAPPGGSPTAPSPTTSPTPLTTPSGTPRTSASTSTSPARPGPTSIPDKAFFRLAAANDKGLESFQDTEALPSVCGARFPSDDTIVQRRTRSLAYKFAKNPADYVPDGSYIHTITIYKAGRADDALRELREAVQACPEQQGTGENPVTYRLRLLDDRGYGDASVLFEIRSDARDLEGNPVEGEEVRLIRAIRIDDVVTILWEQGWEGTSAERTQVDADSRRAVAAIESWLGQR
ncbi:hypothetical protein [Micromonospora thermarum]|uniref:Uncharacterized protein n=1 Tax=Micromonospora thermarum TaxID=2720024 RepID=A0ABX0Z555_9ACTN|nr:hypothetical protein [Micromonospora thermarum]NJP32287.1 hypothetical protein [Micromonospora thermarum]